MRQRKLKNDSVVVRQRQLADGKISLYLDIHCNGVRTKENLRLYLVPETSRIAKVTNNKTLAQAETVRAQRQIDLQKRRYDVLKEYQVDTPFLDYYRKVCEERFKTDTQGNWGIWRSCLAHLEIYCDESTTFREINRDWLEGFKKYLDNAEQLSNIHDGSANVEFVGLSQNSKYSYFNKVKACINQAYSEYIIPVNPLAGVKGFPAAEVKREHLSWEEVDLLDKTECDNPHIKNPFLFSCFTGIRKCDLTKLTWGEIREFDGFTRIVWKQKKTGGQEYLDIPEQAVKYLGERGEYNDNVFKNITTGTQLSIDLQKWMLRAGIERKLTFHCARHTFAVLLLNFGADIFTVSKLLGHKEIKTTQIYAQVLDKKKQEAIGLFPELTALNAKHKGGDSIGKKSKNDKNKSKKRNKKDDEKQ